jgi:hypothetical protein
MFPGNASDKIRRLLTTGAKGGRNPPRRAAPAFLKLPLRRRSYGDREIRRP